jgi:hypothetical protein
MVHPSNGGHQAEAGWPSEDISVLLRICRRKYPADIHNNATVNHATSDVLSAKGFVAPATDKAVICNM